MNLMIQIMNMSYLVALGVLGFEFEELDHVVEEGEEDDGEYVTKTIPNTALIRMISNFN